MQKGIPVETAARVYRRYLKLEPTHAEEYIAYLRSKVRCVTGWLLPAGQHNGCIARSKLSWSMKIGVRLHNAARPASAGQITGCSSIQKPCCRRCGERRHACWPRV